jgi:hypothetical protein
VVEFARAGNGVAVKAGAPAPDISTEEGFKRAMLNAKSIGHSNAGTGPYNTRLFQKLGIYDQIKDKIKIITGKTMAVAVAEGEVEIGIQQTNVIQPVAGTTYLGPLPPELIEYGQIGVAVRNVSKNEALARDLIKFMTSPEAATLLRKSAMERRPGDACKLSALHQVMTSSSRMATASAQTGRLRSINGCRFDCRRPPPAKLCEPFERGPRLRNRAHSLVGLVGVRGSKTPAIGSLPVESSQCSACLLALNQVVLCQGRRQANHFGSTLPRCVGAVVPCLLELSAPGSPRQA